MRQSYRGDKEVITHSQSLSSPLKLFLRNIIEENKDSLFAKLFDKLYLCNVKNLVLHIRYLLTQHDCVIVPGWGALVVQNTSAEFGSDNKLLPPRRWLSFNSLLSHNDGMLAHSVMRAEGCRYDEAMAAITEQVATWHNELKSGNIVEWDRVGTFKYQDNGTMIFNEDADVEVNTSLSILQPIALPQINEVLPSINDDREVVESLDTPVALTWHRHIWQAAASIAAIVVLMLCISTPVDSYESSNNYASLVAVELLGYTTDLQSIDDVNVVSTPVSVEPQEVCESDELPTDKMPEVGTSSVKPTPVNTVDETTQVQPIAMTQQLPRYILVVGSLPSRALAEKQIAEFKQMGVNGDINIYESSGKYRLYIGGGNTMQQAQEQLDSIVAQQQSQFAGIWICSTR